jgi:hypothetical protein
MAGPAIFSGGRSRLAQAAARDRRRGRRSEGRPDGDGGRLPRSFAKGDYGRGDGQNYACLLTCFRRASQSLPPKLHVEPSSMWFIARPQAGRFFCAETAGWERIRLCSSGAAQFSILPIFTCAFSVPTEERFALVSRGSNPGFSRRDTLSPKSSCRAFRPR